MHWKTEVGRRKSEVSQKIKVRYYYPDFGLRSKNKFIEN